MSNILQTIIDETKQILAQKGQRDNEITVDTVFLTDLPMDSLDLATLIVSLEINTGLDPFRTGFKTFHSVGQLVELYESILD
jgi:acyl carrier protein